MNTETKNLSVIAFGNSWIPQTIVNLIAEESYRKRTMRIPIELCLDQFGNQRLTTGKTLTVEEFSPYRRTHRIRVTNTYIQKLQSINHYEVIKEFCPNGFEKEKMLASFVGKEYEIQWVKEKWNSIYEEPEYKWDKNPIVLVHELERL